MNILKYVYILTIITGAIFLPLLWLAVFTPVALGIIYISEKSALNRLKNKVFIAMIILLVAIQPFFYGVREISVAGLAFHMDTFFLGVHISLRATLIMSAFSMLLSAINKKQMDKLWTKAGVKNFSETFEFSDKLFSDYSPQIKSNCKHLIKKNALSEVLPMMLATMIKNADDYSTNTEKN
ncbi:MAG: hypothetical protein ACLFQX_11105, partial [Candidatus Kapaibacterium sp.]